MSDLNEKFYFENCTDMSRSDLVFRVERDLNLLGFGTFFYVGIRVPGRGMAASTYGSILITNALRPRLQRNMFQFERLDPTEMQSSKVHRGPFFWRCEDNRVDPPPAESRLIEAARQAGIEQGYAFPFHGPGAETALFSVAGPQDPAGLEDAVSQRAYRLFILAMRTHGTVTECLLRTGLDSSVRLTDREKQCLLWTVQGKTAWEISRIMDRSSATVNFHLQNAMRKLDAVNKTQAAVRALERDLLRPY